MSYFLFCRFTLDDEKTKISVAQYYREKYNIVLKNVTLPALQAGSDTKPIYLPMEVVLLLLTVFFSFILYERYYVFSSQFMKDFLCFAAL